LHFTPVKVSNNRDGTSVFVEKVKFTFFLVVEVDHVGEGILAKVDRGLGVTGIESIEVLSFDVVVEVVSDDVDLVESSPEGFGGGHVVDISDTENVGVFLVLEGFVVNVQHEIRLGRG